MFCYLLGDTHFMSLKICGQFLCSVLLILFLFSYPDSGIFYQFLPPPPQWFLFAPWSVLSASSRVDFNLPFWFTLRSLHTCTCSVWFIVTCSRIYGKPEVAVLWHILPSSVENIVQQTFSSRCLKHYSYSCWLQNFTLSHMLNCFLCFSKAKRLTQAQVRKSQGHQLLLWRVFDSQAALAGLAPVPAPPQALHRPWFSNWICTSLEVPEGFSETNRNILS